MKQIILRNIFPLLLIAMVTLIAMSGTGCKKETLLKSGGELKFSTDTLSFDTIFTSYGSFTISMRIHNPQNQKIVLSSVRLGNGAASFFRLNVDGFAGSEVNNIEIAANDSAYVFATVKIDPNNDNTPFYIEDKLIATLNGNDFSIPLIAYGQNAHYVIDSLLETDQTWLTDKPYVIIRSAQVAAGKTLTIPAGCRVYMHQSSRLFVDGTLKVNGTKTDSVVFQGDRLDRAYFGYEGYPGEWGGIYFTSKSANNVMTYTILKNGGNTARGFAAAMIQVNPDSSGSLNPQLTLDRVIIQNSIGYGLLAFSAHVEIKNSLIHTCGAQAMALVRGGTYNVDNSTIVNYGTNKVSHAEYSAAILLNYFKNGDVLEAYPLNAKLNNCIIYGSLQQELVVDSIDAAPCNVSLVHCAIKADPAKTRSWVVQTNVLYNPDPMFEKVESEKWDFRLKDGSPLIDKGNPNPTLITDLDGKPRTVNIIDIGAYEHQ